MQDFPKGAKSADLQIEVHIGFKHKKDLGKRSPQKMQKYVELLYEF